ncbi:unnamed protein product [Sphenostylis stenocarpa]|uniref:Polygalacturonase n=1 Tax=Sphenostylis stenocarpa TaxID=92480 RepID=A0AA86SRR6_9FABA|nr:unnamed protein product [Sphenostylis stenocarpa]
MKNKYPDKIINKNAFMSAWQKTCETAGTNTLVIPRTGTFLLKKSTILKGPCMATSILIELQGKIIAPPQNAWQGGSSMILVTNINGLTINGNGGLIDGDGSTWWPCGKNCTRPSVISFNACNGLTVNYLSITNSPKAHITINGCVGATFSHINIQAPGDSPNTDGIDISSSKNILIKDSNIASGDDCIAIIGDSSYINATGIACGPGHGISIGSLGKNNGHDNVEQVHVYNCSFTNTKNGARIKTFQGGPVGVQVSEVTFREFQGTSTDDRAITFACGPQGCLNIVLDHVSITSSSGKPASCSCTNAHGTGHNYNVLDFGAKGDGKTDDSQAFIQAWQSTCGAQGVATLLIPQNYVFLLTPILLKGPCYASTQIQIRGKVVAAEMNAWPTYKSAWIMISNVNGLTVDGSGGLIDGYGSSWWSCGDCQRPSAITFNSCNDLSVSYLSIVNSPKAHMHIHSCVGATFSSISIQSPADTHNTDGMDVYASKNIWIRDSTIACGDDCIAISGGSSYVNVSGIACGPGHGISIGSLGRGNGNTVEEVHVQNCNFTNTKNGARIKTFSDGSGYARGITFEEITLNQVRNPIIIDQFYHNSNSRNGGVEVSGITYRGFQGTCVNGAAITLDCGPQGCTNIMLDGNAIVSTEPGKPATCSCNNAHGTASSTVPDCSCLLP